MLLQRRSALPAHPLAVAFLLVCLLSPALAGDDARLVTPLPTLAEATRGLERRAGLIDQWVDTQGGRIWLELPAPGASRGEVGRYLYVEGLTGGLGSNPVGLDRGQVGPARVIAVRRLGGRVLIELPNLAYRAEGGDAPERRAVEESFATSVIWGGDVVALDPDGTSLVEFTSFVVRDAHDVVARLDDTGQGSYKLDPARSGVEPGSCLAFPENLEFEATLTFAGEHPGSDLRDVVPHPRSITLVQHHSILRLPDPGYRPRRYDPRAGSFAVRFANYAAPLDAPPETRWIVRHRLEKLHPDRESSPVRRPIVYYVDSGTPEPVRSALVEGASWWAEAFAAAGFEDAFRVELLPADVHPLDARYNVIQWVHRSTRGWSYGGGVVDPRTGEMIKGHVSLGSLRVRQDRRIFEALLGADGTGSGSPDDPVRLALARLRQLAAHEVGHTLGFDHNFAASTYGGRASVMDYPAPWLRVGDDGRIDVSRAYGVGVGEWDIQAVRYAYSEFPPGTSEEQALDAIVADGLRRGLVFLSDDDARPAGAAHPLANLWDNGEDPVAELSEVLDVRRVALERFGERNVATGRPLALLEETLAPLYFYHRYQLEAAVKSVGGLDYRHALRGDGQPPTRPVAGPAQRRALERVLSALAPEVLDLPEGLLESLSPRPPGYASNRELFGSRTRPAFDALGAAATAADLVVAGLLQPERCARLVDFHRRDPSLPGLSEVLDALMQRAFDLPAPATTRQAAIVEQVQRTVVAGLIRLSADEQAASAVRGRVDETLARLARRLERSQVEAAPGLATRIRRYLERPSVAAPPLRSPLPAPPGSPIGGPAATGLGGCSMEPYDGGGR